MKNNIIVALLLSSYLVADITFEEWSRRETQSFVNYQTQMDKEFIEMIRYSDVPSAAPDDVKEFATALNIIKTIVPINKPLSEMGINFGLKKADDAGYDHEVLEDSIDDMLDTL